jgi:K+ transport systems, NAD-binding component
MNILLVGEGPETRFFAKALKEKDHRVTVVSHDKSFCTMLADGYGVTAVCGDGEDMETLFAAGAQKADLLIALEQKDAADLMICETAKNNCHVPKTMAVVSDPQNMELFQELGVDNVFCTADFLMKLIEEPEDGYAGR